ncbi:zfwd1 protein [Cryptosporidium ryanae]|uniref:zfwd1 protein n=1 Tax=Cryptosporidium ryanae TaxID=515981 RepID=UPI003519E0D4|nr:zfwd1 protein [Cryptosporidium ryanae]
MRGRWKGGKKNQGNSSQTNNTKVSEICRHFVQQGNCKFGANCNYSHVLRQVAQIKRAHFGGIRCAITSPLPTGELELFTGGCDGQLKRWIIKPADKDLMEGGLDNKNNQRRNYSNSKYQNDMSGATQLSIKMDSTINCNSEVCSCLIYGDVLFCGLINGTIRAFHRPTGSFTDLNGHTQEIHQLLIIDNILVSACWGGKVIFWKFDQPSGTFVISAQIQVKEHIKCLKYFPYKNPNINNLNQNSANAIQQEGCPHLWICGGGILQIVDLINLQIIREIMFDGGPIMSVLEYEKHLVLCSLQGIIRVISITGEETYRKSLGSPTLCMDGSTTADGKHILIMGQNNGHLRCITLPLFDSILEFHTPDTRSEVRLVSNLGGSPGIILTAHWDGALNFYQWCLPRNM